MGDVSWTFCVLLHNPLEDAKFCVCLKQAVALVRLRLQLVSCLGWVSVQFSLTLSCMRRPKLSLSCQSYWSLCCTA